MAIMYLTNETERMKFKALIDIFRDQHLIIKKGEKFEIVEIHSVTGSLQSSAVTSKKHFVHIEVLNNFCEAV